MIFRTVLTDDLCKIQNLICASFDSSLHPYMVSTQHGAEHYLRVFVEYANFHQDRYLLLAESESNDLLGFADFRVLDGGIGFLSYICVTEIARGQGIAKRLISRCLAHFPEIHTVQLDVFEDNHAAKSLYRRLGFEEGSHSVWFVRSCPVISTRKINITDIRFENLPLSLANFEKYGFCELSGFFYGRKIKFGRLGENVLRCFQPEDYEDDVLLAEVRYVFPAISEVFTIVSMDSTIGKTIETRKIVHSIRMNWEILDNTFRRTQ